MSKDCAYPQAHAAGSPHNCLPDRPKYLTSGELERWKSRLQGYEDPEDHFPAIRIEKMERVVTTVESLKQLVEGAVLLLKEWCESDPCDDPGECEAHAWVWKASALLKELKP